jgi:2,4-dienoyl-CoA reductase-like NADH-dependent reductase (Old Yellow Enzyme family)
MPVPQLFRPFTIRGVTFKNRVVVSPMCQYKAVEGDATDWHFAHHARFALGGVGGAFVEATGVTRSGRITQGCTGLWHDGQIAGLTRIVATYHGQNIPVGIQLAHAGRKASASLPWDGAGPLAHDAPEKAWTAVAPSPLALMEGWPTPHELSVPEIDDLVAAFADAARRAVTAGFDLVEIHGAHGYLLHSFLSPLANRRADGYGGPLENRMRLALRVTEAVRAALPMDKALFYRVSAVDAAEGGVTIEDSIALARQLKERGVDVIDVSSGGIFGPIARTTAPQTPGFQVPFASAIRREAGIATMAVGLIIDPAQAEAVLAGGHADLIAMGRELLADPNFPYRAATELGLDDPFAILPAAYAFYLSRRAPLLSAGKRHVS